MEHRITIPLPELGWSQEDIEAVLEASSPLTRRSGPSYRHWVRRTLRHVPADRKGLWAASMMGGRAAIV